MQAAWLLRHDDNVYHVYVVSRLGGNEVGVSGWVQDFHGHNFRVRIATSGVQCC